MEDRNPSPPPEFEKESDIYRADSVGETAISKQWVLSTLMEIINEVESHSEHKEETPLEVTDELQDSACKLWDICMDKEIAIYLLDFDIVEILYGIILKSKSPRLTEISVGILGNMACSDVACEAISKLTHLRSAIIALLGSPDTQTLLETVRLIRICCSNQTCCDDWVASINEGVADFIEYCQFILRSSTHGKLLGGISEMLDMTFEFSQDVLTAACTEDFIGALLEAVSQLSKDDPSNSLHSLCHSLHSLHTISENATGRALILTLRRSIAAVISSVCYEWITSHPKVDYSDQSRMSASEVSVSCCLSLIDVILQPAWEGGREEVDQDTEESVGNGDCVKTEKVEAENGEKSALEEEDDLSEEEKVQEKVKKVEEMDDEDRELMIKFAHSVVSAKGVVSALAVMLALNSEEDNPNEFKTPLHFLRNSPCVTTPVSSSLLTRSTNLKQSSEGLEGIAKTPVSSPVVHRTSPGDSTPPRVESGDFTPPARERSGDKIVDLPPPTVLCDLAQRVLRTARDQGFIANGDSPRKAAT